MNRSRPRGIGGDRRDARVAHGMRSLTCAAAAALLAAPLFCQSTADQELPLGLSEAIARALQANEEILIQQTRVAAAEAGEEGSRGAYDPLVSIATDWRRTSPPINSAFSGTATGALSPTQESAQASASVSQLLASGAEVSLSAATARSVTDSVFDLLSPAWDSRLGVELRQPLLRDRAIDSARGAIRVAAADRRAAEASFQRVVTETVAAVESAYWSLVAARGEIEVREEAVRLAEEQLDETRLRIEGGLSPETEEAQPRAELERRRGDLLAARELVRRTESALRRLIAAEGDDALWTARLRPIEPVQVERPPLDLERALETALAQRSELEVAKALVERRAVEGELAENEIANLDLVVSYDRFGLAGSGNPILQGFSGMPADVPPGLEGNLGDSLASIIDGDFEDLSIGLVLDFALGATEARAEKAIAAQARIAAEAELRKARKAVRVEVLDAAAALETASARIDAARAGREAAAVQLDAERERYAVGLSTNFLVLTRQNDLARAQLAEIGALTDYRIADTALRRATGSLLEDRSIDIGEAE